MSTKIKVYSIQSGDIVNIYTLTYEGEDITIDQVKNLVVQAKRKFKIPGKLYTILAFGKVFHAGRVGKKWKIYELKEVEEENEYT